MPTPTRYRITWHATSRTSTRSTPLANAQLAIEDTLAEIEDDDTVDGNFARSAVEITPL